MKTAREHAEAIKPSAIRMAGMIRRMAISVTAKALWQLVGYRLPGGQESPQAEVFSGIGFYARPPTTGAPEAIVLMVGDAKQPVIVAVRDEKTRAAIAGGLAPNETALFNSLALFLAKADGTLEARSAAGVAHLLALKADLDNLKTAITNWVPVAGDGGAALKTALLALFAGPPAWPAGTTKFKGE